MGFEESNFTIESKLLTWFKEKSKFTIEDIYTWGLNFDILFCYY